MLFSAKFYTKLKKMNLVHRFQRYGRLKFLSPLGSMKFSEKQNAVPFDSLMLKI